MLDSHSEKFLGLILKAKRVKKGFTQEYVCEMLNIPIRYLSEMENGKRNVDHDTFSRIYDTLK